MEAVIQVFLEKLTTSISDEIGLLSGVDDEVLHLQNHLQWMSESIRYAYEKRRSDDSYRLVRTWVGQIRTIAFEAEDIIDEFIVKVHLLQLEEQFKKRHGVRARIKVSLKSFFSTPKQVRLRHELGTQIRKINDKAQILSTTKDMYLPLVNGETFIGGSGSSVNNIPSLQEKIKIRRDAIAREEYRDAANIHENSARQITDSLMGNEGNDDSKRLRVISIVGMGGVGKTTLAKRVYYNDDTVMQNFETFAFIYISQTYVMKDLLRSLIKHFSSVAEEEISCSRLYRCLEESKYLIVLDDIWDTDAWDGIKNAFPDKNNGSRVLLTTRHKHVARYAGSSFSTNIHDLGVITKFDESWELFLMKTFPSSYNRSTGQQFVCPEELENLGKQMVEKCHGLPLAIVVLGSLLSSKETSDHVWSKVNNSVHWHLNQSEQDSYKCLGILALSYNDLPYFLKPCFLYMSMFPEDCEIRATKLFQYWIAEGFVKKRDELTLEDVAEEYLDELISRSLIQIDRLSCDGRRVKTCRVHDLLRDLAIEESKEDQFSQICRGVQGFRLNESNVRRVFVCSTSDDSQKEQYFTKFRPVIAVRSLMFRGVQFLQHNYLNSLFGGFKLLRVLEISGSPGLCTGPTSSLPEELGELVHLRYLSLEDTKLEKLNTSYLRKLVNLQVLNLNRCGTKLTLEDKIGSLHQLRHLYLGGLGHDISGTSCTAFNHLGIGDLTNLQLLRIEAGDWILGGGLKSLCSLKKLRIDGCLSAHSVQISGAIAKLVALKSLMLQSLSTEGVPLTSISFAGHTNLQNLLLKGELRGWSGIVSFPPNITKLILEESRVVADPMVILEKLPKLTFLHLGFNSYVGTKMVCSEGGFVGLQTLRLVSLENVEQWIVEKGALGKLTHLDILLCGKMATLPVKQLISLQKLTFNATNYTSNQWLEAPELASLI
ncbi:hypothetical protein MKX03_013406 [Papaver bracteatum]|nr:hypothetical protein MKX03_013406 [Papaver bracteatum]